MRGHGNVVVGPDVRLAVARAVYTDENARLQSIAMKISLGRPYQLHFSGRGSDPRQV